MDLVVTIATILGGIAAIWYLGQILTDAIKSSDRGSASPGLWGRCGPVLRNVQKRYGLVLLRVWKRLWRRSREKVDTAETICQAHFGSVQSTSSREYLFQQAGRVYDQISHLRREADQCVGEAGFDHAVVWEIAGWIKDHVECEYVVATTQREVARGIADQIFAYLKSSGRPENLFLADSGRS